MGRQLRNTVWNVRESLTLLVALSLGAVGLFVIFSGYSVFAGSVLLVGSGLLQITVALTRVRRRTTSR